MRSLPYLALFFVIGIILYFPIFSVGFAGDDYLYLTKQPYFHSIHAPIDLFRSVINAPPAHNYVFGYFYRPIPFTLYALLYYYTHANPFYFHLLQFTAYSTAVFLFFLFCTRFFTKNLALLLAIIFLI